MEFIDDHPVVEHQMRFRKRTVLDEAEAARVRDGDVVLWLVRARCLPPQYFPMRKEPDERYKLAIQDVEDAAPLDGALRESAIVYLDHGQDQGYIAVEGQASLPLELAFQAPRHTPVGVFDPVEVAELSAIRDYLSELGELHEGERLAAAVRRVVEERTNPIVAEFDAAHARASNGAGNGMDDPEYAAAYERATAVLAEEPEPVRVSAGPSVPVLGGGGDVEVVGTIYRGRRSDLQTLLKTEFGDH